MRPEVPRPPAPTHNGPRAWLSLVVLLAVVWGGHQLWSWWRGERMVEQVQHQARDGDIVMFTTDSCPYCARASRWLDANQVPWTECNIDHNAQCLTLFQARGAPGVPLMHVKGQWRLGFDPVWVAQALERTP